MMGRDHAGADSTILNNGNGGAVVGSHARTKFPGLSALSATGGTRQLLRLFLRQGFGFHLVRMQSLVNSFDSLRLRAPAVHLPLGLSRSV